MTATSLFHIGISVSKFSEVLGLTFKHPAIGHVDRFDQASKAAACGSAELSAFSTGLTLLLCRGRRSVAQHFAAVCDTAASLGRMQ